MISKSQLKDLCLYKQQKQCDADNVFVVEGVKMCCEALASGQPVVAVAALPEWLQEHSGQWARIPTLHQDHIYELAPSDLDRLSGQKSPNQVWMLLKRPLWDDAVVEGREVSDDNLLLLLDHLQDPGNLGTVIRTADWFGIRHIYCSNDTVSCYNPKVVQATMGGIFRTKMSYEPLVPLMQRLRSEGHEIYGAMLDGVNVYHLSTQAQKESCPADDVSRRGNSIHRGEVPHASAADKAYPASGTGSAPSLTPQNENRHLCQTGHNTFSIRHNMCKVLVIGNESRGITDDVAAMVTKRVKIPNLGGTCESLNAGIAAAVLISELLRDKSAQQQ